jgi:hypothetical protein
MNKKQIAKKEKRLQEIKAVLDKEHNSSLLEELNEIQFDLNKRHINFVLRGDTKYYYANQCALFIHNLLRYGYNGFEKITKKEIAEKDISFNKYSINLGSSQYDRDIKRGFNSKEELLGFVVGYNEAQRKNN